MKLEDVKFLMLLAADMIYNSEEEEAINKHRLYEIAMRIETDFYNKEPKMLTAKVANALTMESVENNRTIQEIRKAAGQGLLSVAVGHTPDLALLDKLGYKVQNKSWRSSHMTHHNYVISWDKV